MQPTRKKNLRLVLTALIVFAIGPGLALHAMGDLYHANQTHHEHALDFADFDFDGEHHDENACALEHDHDQSHTASVSALSLLPPSGSTEVKLTVIPVVYSPESQAAPLPLPSAKPQKPPRLITSV